MLPAPLEGPLWDPRRDVGRLRNRETYLNLVAVQLNLFLPQWETESISKQLSDSPKGAYYKAKNHEVT